MDRFEIRPKVIYLVDWEFFPMKELISIYHMDPLSHRVLVVGHPWTGYTIMYFQKRRERRDTAHQQKACDEMRFGSLTSL